MNKRARCKTLEVWILKCMHASFQTFPLKTVCIQMTYKTKNDRYQRDCKIKESALLSSPGYKWLWSVSVMGGSPLYEAVKVCRSAAYRFLVILA